MFKLIKSDVEEDKDIIPMNELKPPEFNELIEVLEGGGKWVKRHFVLNLPDGKVLCWIFGEKYPEESETIIWDEWRPFENNEWQDAWQGYTF